MIQFNLLPNVKLEYIKAARSKRLVISASLLVSAIVLAVVLLLIFIVYGVKGPHLKNLNSDIERYSSELASTKDIDKILTIQNQLKGLPALHESKSAATRMFSSYISQLTPSTVTLSKMTLDFEEGTIVLEGASKELRNVNVYVDTLKFTTYNIINEEIEEEAGAAFSDVVLTSFSRNTKEGAAFQIELKFDSTIFDNTKKVSLVVPKLTTTRSEIERPDNIDELFKEQPKENR